MNRHIQICAFFFIVFFSAAKADTDTTDYDSVWIEKILASLSLEQKIAQLMVVAVRSDKTFEKANDPINIDEVMELILKYGVGGIIFLGKNTFEITRDWIRSFQRMSKVPLLVCLDAEWGLGMRLANTMSFPRNNILGNADSAVVRCIAGEIGRQLALIGVHMNFAPVIDVNNNPNNPVIGSRSFGDNPVTVADKGIAFMLGLNDAGILSCAKHFPGHGDTEADSHITLPLIAHDKDRLRSIELYPFVELIRRGVPAVMTAHLAIPALESDSSLPSSLSYNIITNLLKKELGFEGLVITDALDMRGVTNGYKPGDIELRALLAGNDILLCPLDVPEAILLIKKAVENGKISEQEIDIRVKKILAAKTWALTRNPESLNPVCDYDQLHTPQAYDLQQRALQTITN